MIFMRSRLLFFFFFCLGNPHSPCAQSDTKIVVSGYVKELGSDEVLAGVNIRLLGQPRGTASTQYGFYSLGLPRSVDSVALVFSSVGYATVVQKISGRQSLTLDVRLPRAQTVLAEVEVSGQETNRVPLPNTLTVSPERLKSIPVLLGEKDLIRALQLMPGIQKGADGSGALYVRGGGQDQNLLILDDAVVYNAYHAFGLFSVFNSDAVKSVELAKGGFPARYGGRLSSVLNIQMKEGNKEKFKGAGSIGLLASRLTLEAPIVKEKSSFIASGRRTYIDLFTRPLMGDELNVGYYFYDLNLKANHDFGRKDKLYASVYLGKDQVGVREKDNAGESYFGMRWNSATATLRWNHLFSEKLFANTALVFSDYTFGLDRTIARLATPSRPAAQDELRYQSTVRDLGVKTDFDFLPNDRHQFRFGAQLTRHLLNPNTVREFNSRLEPPLRTNTSNEVATTEGGAYLEDHLRLGGRLSAHLGIRGAYFQTGGQTLVRPEPRASLQYNLRDDYLVQASYARMNQFIHLLSNSGVGLPTDMWVPSKALVSPQTSDLITAGLAKTLKNQEYSITVESYYKQMHQILSLREGESFLRINSTNEGLNVNYQADGWESKITQGRGWSYGGELLLQKNLGKLTGWLGYTLSWTYHQFADINNGEKFHPRQDRRHDVSVVASYQLSPRITLSANWVYGTGQAITPPASNYNASYHFPGFSLATGPTSAVAYPPRGSIRLPAYHRLDLGIQFHKQKKRWRRVWEISIVNAYNRQNPAFLYYDNLAQNGAVNELKQVVLMPFIPSVNYSFTF
jgi:TonB dependent receptor/TonB-dependent Receptor Plug Domain/CarboxypepD_reg-like domain